MNVRTSPSLASFDVHNPATGEIIASLPDRRVDEMRAAVTAAEMAQREWRRLPARARAERLHAWHDAIVAHRESLAAGLTREQGKPLDEARAEISYAADYVRWFAEEAPRIHGDVLPFVSAERQAFTVKEPVGVVAAITPWNFPAAMITRKVAPALAAGCTIVVKPADETPLTALELQALAIESGIPEAAFAVVCGTDAAALGEALCADTRVRKLTFTGSTRVGKLLLSQSADTVKKVSMELGGNAPLIVFDDADLDRAVTGTVASKFRNSGQTCISANRILVHEAIYAEFAAQLVDVVRQLSVGEGSAGGVDLGPLINRHACRRIEQQVQSAVEQGAEILCGGTPLPGQGSFYAPTVLTGASASMAVCRDEIFGPVAPLVPFGTEEEAVALANATAAGLAAYCFTGNSSRAWRMSQALDYGMVGINDVALSSAAAPFGGIKESGLGREGSRHGIDDYLELKYIAMAN